MRSAAPARPSTADDDELPGLPSIVGDDEPAGDLGIDDGEELDDGDEEIGLDVSAGVDEEEDFLDELDDGLESAEWDSEEEALEEDPELDEGDEGGWTEGSEAAEAPGWDSDLDEADEDEPAPLVRDTGDEGVEERLESGGDDDAPVELPHAHADVEDELAEDLELEGEGEIETLPGDERVEHPALSLRRVLAETRWLGPEDEAILAIGSGLAGGRSVYRIGPERLVDLDAMGLDGDEPTSIARAASGAIVIGLQLGGVARSTDDGSSFAVLEPLRRGGEANVGAFHVLADPHASGVRLWGLTRGGALVRSDDEGVTWSRPLIPGAVLAIGLDVGGGVVGVLGARGGAMRLVRSTEGGRSWRNVPGPTIVGLPDEHELHVAAMGSTVVITTDVPGLAPFITHDDGQHWQTLDALRDAGAVAFARTPSGPVLFAGVLAEGTDRGLVVQQPLPSGSATVVVDLEQVRARHHVAGAGDPEGDQRVHALVADVDDGGTTLWIGSGIGLVRARVEHE